MKLTVEFGYISQSQVKYFDKNRVKQMLMDQFMQKKMVQCSLLFIPIAQDLNMNYVQEKLFAKLKLTLTNRIRTLV